MTDSVEVVVQRLQAKSVELERLNAELGEREARLRAILDTEPQCVKLVAPDGRLLDMNRAGLAMLEAESLTEVRSRPLGSFVAEPHRAAFSRLAESVFRGQSGSLPFEVVGLKGRRRWLETHAAPLRDAAGAIVALVGVTRDITEDKRAEALAREAQDRYLRQRDALIALTSTSADYQQGLGPVLGAIAECAARTLRVARVGVWRYAEHQRVLRCVEQYDAIQDGHASGAVLRRADFPAYFRSLDRREVVVAHDAFRDASTAEFLDSYLRPQGITSMLDTPVQVFGNVDGVLCLEHVGPPRHWNDDEQVFGLAMANLVSLALEGWERYRAETELREAQARLRRAASAGNVGLWEWDLLRGVLEHSPELTRQLGYGEDEIAVTLAEWEERLHPDDRDAAVRALRAYLDRPGPFLELEVRVRHKNGTYRQVLVRASLLRDETSGAVRLLGSHLDITEYAELQARFLQSQKMESVGQLAGGIAHDFNNLLTVINGTAEIALGSLKVADPLRADVLQILDAGNRAATLTRQLLAFSRQQLMKPEVLDLNVVVSDMHGILQRLIGEHLDLIVEASPGLHAVRADRGQVEQIIMNLAVNARDAMPDGGVLTIETRNVELDASYAADHPSVTPGPHVMLAISDTGVGINPATRARIFEPFFTTKDPARGTGLGLSTVYGIVKQSGGTIWVYSEVGRGSTFKVYLPIVDDVPSSAPSPPRTPVPVYGRETILIVEDEPAVQRLAARVLEGAGYRVLTAADAGEALALLAGHDDTIHLMLTDVVMPGLTGRELAEEVAQRMPRMKVIFTSGYTDDTVVRFGVIADTARFIAKPYTAMELTLKVREALDADTPDRAASS